MNPVLENIYSRRSVRSYLPQQITKAELTTVLEAGLQAPSAMNQQTWHFIAVQDEKAREQVRALCVSVCGMQADADPFYQAPTIVLVFGKDDTIAPDKDCSLAIQNMMLAAHAIGLGTCWINCVCSAFSAEEGKTLAASFGLADGYHPVGSLALGVPSGAAAKPKEVRKNYTIV